MSAPVGILGGTFDPVHNGHLGLARETCRSCGLAQVRLVPVHSPPHRAKPLALPRQRLEMLRLATAGETGLCVDDREQKRSGTSYTIDTLRSFRDEYGSRSLCLILGADAFCSLAGWHQWKQLIEYAHFIVARRPGTRNAMGDPGLVEMYNERLTTALQDLSAYPAGKIYEVDITERDISSSRIRALIGQGREVDGLLPGNVISYIRTEGLYHRH